MVSFNGTRAAIEAGYAVSGASVRAANLLASSKIQDAIERRTAEIVEKSDAKRAYILDFWQSVIDDPKATVFAKLRASDLMAKYLAMYGGSMELYTGKDSPIRVIWNE